MINEFQVKKRYLLRPDNTPHDALISPIYYWPKGIVYYTFDANLGWL